MDRDTVIALARKAGISESHAQGMQGFLERFAALVYEHTWKEANIAATRTVLDAAVLAEREACAKVCDEQDHNGVMIAADCAAAIRSRA